MARASLRRIGLSDARIEIISTREAYAEVIVYEALSEMAKDKEREEAWLNRAVADSAAIKVTSVRELADSMVTTDDLS